MIFRYLPWKIKPWSSDATRENCYILTFDPAINQETGASGRRYPDITLTGWIRFNCGAHKKQVEVKQLYNRVPQMAWVSWSQELESVCWSSSCSSRQGEPTRDRGLGPSGPRLSSPAEWGRSATMTRGTWGQYVAVCSVSNSPLTHNPFTTLSNKVWEVYSSKEVCSFVIIVDYVSAYICIRIVVSRLYNRIKQWLSMLPKGIKQWSSDIYPGK